MDILLTLCPWILTRFLDGIVFPFLITLHGQAHVRMVFAQHLDQAKDMSNPYVFPPFGLIGPVLRFLYGYKLSFSIVVPEFRPLPYWWPELMARCECRIILGIRGDMDTLLKPSKKGFRPVACPFNLWVVRVSY